MDCFVLPSLYMFVCVFGSQRDTSRRIQLGHLGWAWQWDWHGQLLEER